MSEDFEAPKDDLDKELPAGSEEHSDYKPADAKDANIKHQLSGMYQNWFLDYASYVILERAVPHINDGLKPVQRRILHSMKRLDDGRYNKVANIVGHTMQFHPHGDASIGDALVQLGQKDLLIDCQGNWGNILTGDGAAAPRYIEARLSKFALDVVFNPKTTEWKLSYDGRNKEPVTLPVKFPLLLAQGVEGIAVGLSSKILPHNFNELINAAIAHLQGREFQLYPDFPTGGIMMGRVGVRNAYKTGKGSILVRAKTEIEEHNGRQRIIVTELPYQVNKAKLVESVANMVKDKRLEGIADIREESDRHGMRIVFDLKRDANAQVVLNSLFKQTQLQVSDGITLLALADGEPKILSLKEILSYYIEHQKVVIRRRTEFDLEKAEDRYHIIEGLVIALDNIDEMVDAIRAFIHRKQTTL